MVNSSTKAKTAVTENNAKKSKVKKGLDWYYLQYCLVTGLYMVEPWERALFNIFVIVCFSIFIALGYVFLPIF